MEMEMEMEKLTAMTGGGGGGADFFVLSLARPARPALLSHFCSDRTEQDEGQEQDAHISAEAGAAARSRNVLAQWVDYLARGYPSVQVQQVLGGEVQGRSAEGDGLEEEDLWHRPEAAGDSGVEDGTSGLAVRARGRPLVCPPPHLLCRGDAGHRRVLLAHRLLPLAHARVRHARRRLLPPRNLLLLLLRRHG
eukprot:285630-Hanusia_phi.AAC.1